MNMAMLETALFLFLLNLYIYMVEKAGVAFQVLDWRGEALVQLFSHDHR